MESITQLGNSHWQLAKTGESLWQQKMWANLEEFALFGDNCIAHWQLYYSTCKTHILLPSPSTSRILVQKQPPYKSNSAKYVVLSELAHMAILCQMLRLTVKESQRISFKAKNALITVEMSKCFLIWDALKQNNKWVASNCKNTRYSIEITFHYWLRFFRWCFQSKAAHANSKET